MGEKLTDVSGLIWSVLIYSFSTMHAKIPIIGGWYRVLVVLPLAKLRLAWGTGWEVTVFKRGAGLSGWSVYQVLVMIGRAGDEYLRIRKYGKDKTFWARRKSVGLPLHPAAKKLSALPDYRRWLIFGDRMLYSSTSPLYLNEMALGVERI